MAGTVRCAIRAASCAAKGGRTRTAQQRPGVGPEARLAVAASAETAAQDPPWHLLKSTLCELFCLRESGD